MKEIAARELVVGATALMRVGSPVRRWLRVLGGRRRRWLTPVRYMPPGASRDLDWLPQYVTVDIGMVRLPYAVMYHHDGSGWVQLWIDTRDVALYLPN
jgi:hypothetical protein